MRIIPIQLVISLTLALGLAQGCGMRSTLEDETLAGSVGGPNGNTGDGDDSSGGACSDGDPDTDCSTGVGDSGDDPACSDGDESSECPDESGGDGDGEDEEMPPCGAGVKPCNLSEFNGATCESLGYEGGELYCDPVSCLYDTELCDGGGDTGGDGDYGGGDNPFGGGDNPFGGGGGDNPFGGGGGGPFGGGGGNNPFGG